MTLASCLRPLGRRYGRKWAVTDFAAVIVTVQVFPRMNRNRPIR